MALSHKLSMPKLGNTGVSSLVKSAQSLTNELNTYKDTVQQISFENNPNDASLSSYLKYLKGRVGVLSTTGSITDATKAINMQQSMRTAISKNTSFNIQNESIQVLSGTGTNQNKLDYIQGAYSRAMSVGDVTLAQSLESQAYSLSQTIQYQQQVASENAVSLNNANEAAIKKGYTNAIDAVKSGLTDIYTQFQNGGSDKVQSSLQTFTKKFGSTYKQLTGKTLPAGSQLTMGSITQAYFNAEYAYNTRAAASLEPTNPEDAQRFTQAAQDLVSGKATIDVPGAGSVNVYQATAWAASPNLYRVETDVNGKNTLAENAVTGYKMVNGIPTPESTGQTGSAYGSLDKNTQTQLQGQLSKLGLNLISKNGSLKAQFTTKSDKWTQYGKAGSANSDLKNGQEVTLIPLANGSLQFEKNGKIYTIATDARGLGGVQVTDSTGSSKFVAGQYGFNQSVNTLISGATVQQLQQKAQQQIAVKAQQAQSAREEQAASIITSAKTSGGVPGSFQLSQHASGASMMQRAGGGFNFGYNGKPISAAQYSKLTGTPFRTLLQTMANKGDTGARTALGFVGNDYKYDPTKETSYQNAGTYNALTWGAGVSSNTGKAPASLLGNGAQLKF